VLFSAQMPRECTVWIAAHHKEKRALEILAREIAPAGTGMGEGLKFNCLIFAQLHRSVVNAQILSLIFI